MDEAELATRRQQVSDRIASLRADIARADRNLGAALDGRLSDGTYECTVRVARDGLQRQLDVMLALAERLDAETAAA